MRDTTLKEHIQNVSYGLNALLFYLCLVVAALSGYYKMFSIWKAVVIAAPAVLVYLFGSRSLRMAFKAATKGNAE